MRQEHGSDPQEQDDKNVDKGRRRFLLSLLEAGGALAGAEIGRRAKQILRNENEDDNTKQAFERALRSAQAKLPALREASQNYVEALGQAKKLLEQDPDLVNGGVEQLWNKTYLSLTELNILTEEVANYSQLADKYVNSHSVKLTEQEAAAFGKSRYEINDALQYAAKFAPGNEQEILEALQNAYHKNSQGGTMAKK